MSDSYGMGKPWYPGWGSKLCDPLIINDLEDDRHILCGTGMHGFVTECIDLGRYRAGKFPYISNSPSKDLVYFPQNQILLFCMVEYSPLKKPTNYHVGLCIIGKTTGFFRGQVI